MNLPEEAVTDLCRAHIIAHIIDEIEMQQLDFSSVAKSELLNILTECLDRVHGFAIGLCVLNQREKL